MRPRTLLALARQGGDGVSSSARAAGQSMISSHRRGLASSSTTKVTANSLRVGQVIARNGGYFSVVAMQHRKPGKGGAYQQLELRDLVSGTKSTERLRSDDTLEVAFVDDVSRTLLFQDSEGIHVMCDETYEQTVLPEGLLSRSSLALLGELKSTPIQVGFVNGMPLRAKLPREVCVAIYRTEEHKKGFTVTPGLKPAELQCGIWVNVPPYISEGDKIYINTDTLEFLRRADGTANN